LADISSIDTSILDERVVNRPGAKMFKYSGDAAKFGVYREPPQNKMKDVRDKYVFKKPDENKPDLDELAVKISRLLPFLTPFPLGRMSNLRPPSLWYLCLTDTHVWREQKAVQLDIFKEDQDEGEKTTPEVEIVGGEIPQLHAGENCVAYIRWAACALVSSSDALLRALGRQF
jgi:hypothetical protein